jgi:lipopolysaccharide transport system permease protein
MAAFVDFCIAGCIFIGMMIGYAVPLSPTILYIIPLMLLEIGFIIGISLFVSAANVYYRDVRYVIPLIVQLWMYASPVIYPVSMVPENLKTWYMLNPMAFIIDSFRNIVLRGKPPDIVSCGIAAAVIFLLAGCAYAFFKKIEMSFADVI